MVAAVNVAIVIVSNIEITFNLILTLHMNPSRYFVIVLLNVLILSIASGCSGGGGPVIEGTVTMDGSKPLSHADIELIPTDLDKAGGAHAITDKDGKFSIESHPQKSAVKPGKYYVLVSKWVDPKTKQTPKEKDGMDLEQMRLAGMLRNIVPARYSDRETPMHLIEVEITDGENNLKVNVKSR